MFEDKSVANPAYLNSNEKSLAEIYLKKLMLSYEFIRLIALTGCNCRACALPWLC